ncbi:MAG: galactose-1-phosphate uridylyltransferase [Methanoculleaceae archaeon]
MFTVHEIAGKTGTIQYRHDNLTGISCRIAPGRRHRHLGREGRRRIDQGPCPFCPGRLMAETPEFPWGGRLERGESVTFPNLFPFADCHIVTVLTREHAVEEFTVKQIADGISAQAEILCSYPGFTSINWNHLSTAGASITHPHLQGIGDPRPSFLHGLLVSRSLEYYATHGHSYWSRFVREERDGPRYLFGDEILWCASPVPLGEAEIRGVLPVSNIRDLDRYIIPLADGLCRILRFYRQRGNRAFNMALYLAKPGLEPGFMAICSVIARINPTEPCPGDSAFMERLHLEPVVLTRPEDLAEEYRRLSVPDHQYTDDYQ